MDFYDVLSPQKDRSANPKASSDTSCMQTTQLYSLTEAADLTDVWRNLHPLEGDFTYFSHLYRSLSRLDTFLMSPKLLPQVFSA